MQHSQTTNVSKPFAPARGPDGVTPSNSSTGGDAHESSQKYEHDFGWRPLSNLSQSAKLAIFTATLAPNLGAAPVSKLKSDVSSHTARGDSKLIANTNHVMRLLSLRSVFVDEAMAKVRGMLCTSISKWFGRYFRANASYLPVTIKYGPCRTDTQNFRFIPGRLS